MRSKAILVLVCLLMAGAVEALAEFHITSIVPEEVQVERSYNITIAVKNLATDYALNVRAYLNPDERAPLRVIGTKERFVHRAGEAKISEQYFGAVLQNEELRFTYPVYVEQVEEGVYPVKLLIKWKDGNMVEHQQELSFGIYVQGRAEIGIGSIRTQPQDVRAGMKRVMLSFRIKNTGTKTLNTLKVYAEFAPPLSSSYSSSDTSYLGTLSPGGEAEAVLYFDVDEHARAGEHIIPVRVEFSDRMGRKYSVTENLKLLIKPKPLFEVVALGPEKVAAGEKATIRLRIRNAGYEQAENLGVKIIRLPEQPFEYERNADYIGNVEPGDTEEAVFIIKPERDAPPKRYPLRVALRYIGDRDSGDSTVYMQELQTSLQVVPGEKSSRMPVVVGISLLALIAIFLLRRRT